MKAHSVKILKEDHKQIEVMIFFEEKYKGFKEWKKTQIVIPKSAIRRLPR